MRPDGRASTGRYSLGHAGGRRAMGPRVQARAAGHAGMCGGDGAAAALKARGTHDSPGPRTAGLAAGALTTSLVFTNSDKAHVEQALHRLGLQGLLCSQITRTWFRVQSLSLGNRMDYISKIKTLGLFLSRNTSKLISTGKKLKIASAMTSIHFKVLILSISFHCCEVGQWEHNERLSYLNGASTRGLGSTRGSRPSMTWGMRLDGDTSATPGSPRLRRARTKGSPSPSRSPPKQR